MEANDQERFIGAVSAALDVYGRERGDGVLALWWRLLEPWPIDSVLAALTDHLRRSRFAPSPADIIEQLHAADGRPTSAEAWGICPRDEHAAVVWTDEIAQAFAACAGLLVHRDETGARMAFREAYDSAIRTARSARRPVRWWLSRGHDRADDERAVNAALVAGRITVERARQYLPEIGRNQAPAIATMKMPALKAMR